MSSTPKYEKVIEYVLKYIQENQLKKDDQLPTEKELTETLDYSRITIQRGLNELQESGIIYRIQGCGSYVGTPPEIIQSNNAKIIPLVMSRDSGATRFFEILQGIENCLDEMSYYISVHVTDDDEDEELKVINKLIERDFKYIMVAPVRSDRNVEFFFDLIHKGINFVFIDILPNHLCGNLVSSDNVRGGFLAADHLIKQGYKRIQLLTTATSLETSIIDRIEGFRMALKIANYPHADENFITYYDFDKDVSDTVRNMMRQPSPPDAIFAINDVTAVHIYNSLVRDGYKIPQDVAVMGFDNLEMTSSPETPITSIDQKFFQIGYQAADLCISLMKHENPSIQHRYLPVSLVTRESTLKNKK